MLPVGLAKTRISTDCAQKSPRSLVLCSGQALASNFQLNMNLNMKFSKNYSPLDSNFLHGEILHHYILLWIWRIIS